MRLDELLDRLASDSPTPGGGSVAALVVAMSAGLLAMAARASREGWAEASGAIAQAESLRSRVTPLAAKDAQAYEAALTAMRAPLGATAEERDAAIADALAHAAQVPLEIAESAADAAALAATVAERGDEKVRGDAAAAAVLAAAAARAAANLVAINLATSDDDRRVARARRIAAEAVDSARWTLDLERPS
jgi:methenyltetrahydrofolate cyclohydrolase